jgi:SIR2-like protein
MRACYCRDPLGQQTSIPSGAGVSGPASRILFGASAGISHPTEGHELELPRQTRGRGAKSLDSADVASHIQGLFRKGLVTVVGSGLSVAQGLPSTAALGKHLLDSMPGKTSPEEWEPYAERLNKGVDLESAFDDLDEDSDLLRAVTTEVASCVAQAEAGFLRDHHAKLHLLPFAQLIPHLPTADGATVITTNYDRLLEIAAEAARCPVDTMFDGAYHGRLDPQASREAHRTVVRGNGRHARVVDRAHVKVLKPHGSLDWRRGEVEPYRTLLAAGGAPLVITPGGSKYRRGYEAPFEQHRSHANEAIRDAQSFLILGFGFNDDHLQHELQGRLKAGVPAFVAAEELSANALEVLAQASRAIGAEAASADATRIHHGVDEITELPASQMWSLGPMITEVLT